MDDDFQTPFPFCNRCATWHEPDKHMPRWNPHRATFWYGWIWGAACTSGFLLVVRLLWITG